MTKCILRRYILSALNKVLSDHRGNVAKTREVVDLWLSRADKVTNALKGLSQKLEDHLITDEELEAAVTELKALVENWK